MAGAPGGAGGASAPEAGGTGGAGGAGGAGGGAAGGWGDGGAVAAVVENRAREVGLAVLLPGLAVLEVQQFVEASPSYGTLGALLQVHRPGAVVTLESPHAQASGVLGANAVVAALPCSTVARPRSDFNDVGGRSLLFHLAENAEEVENLSSGESRGWYLAFGAVHALMRHCDGESFAAASLRVVMAHSLLHVFLDSRSLETLEVFESLKPAAPPAGARGGGLEWGRAGGREGSLFDVIDYTVTSVGAMKLRASLVQPFKDAESITARHVAVEELLKGEHLADVSAALRQLPRGLNRLCAAFCTGVPNEERGAGPAHLVARARKNIQAVLELRDVLLLLPQIAESLGPAQSPLLAAVREILHSPEIGQLAEAVDAFIDPDAAKANDQFVKMTEHVFSVRGGVSGFLDLARKTFLDLTEGVHATADEYRRDFCLPEMKLQFTQKRGFWVVFPKRHQFEVLQQDMPGKFVELSSAGRGRGKQARAGAVHCSTAELGSFNSRLRHAYANCYRLTDDVLRELMASIGAKICILRALADSLGMLDLLQSFARYAADRHCVRPTVSRKNGPLAIICGRHPILECDESAPFSPNSTFMSEYHTLEMVFGPNGGGKTTYLRQTAQLVLLAQAGSFVPAEFMSLSCVDAFFARSLMADEGGDLGEGKSSFLQEMADVARIEQCATSQSLVLVDEVGRATGAVEGMAVAWAVAEKLLSIRCKALFATHFTPLSRLSHFYPTCTVRCFRVKQSGGDLKFTCDLGQQVTEPDLNYGILLARASALPTGLVDSAAATAEAYANMERSGRHTAALGEGRHIMHTAFKVAGRVSILGALFDAGHISLDLVLAEMEELRGQATHLAATFHETEPPPAAAA